MVEDATDMLFLEIEEQHLAMQNIKCNDQST